VVGAVVVVVVGVGAVVVVVVVGVGVGAVVVVVGAVTRRWRRADDAGAAAVVSGAWSSGAGSSGRQAVEASASAVVPMSSILGTRAIARSPSLFPFQQ
jgi:hypothetical protein